jgi:hydrogenase maturation factor
MCDSALHQVIQVIDKTRVVARDLDGTNHEVSLLALDGEIPCAGTWLVVHSGYAIDRVEESDARTALDELRRARAIDSGPQGEPLEWEMS